MAQLLTVKEVAELLSTSPQTVRNLCKSGKLTYLVYSTKKMYIPESSVESFIKKYAVTN
ncbi:MAG: helix-turn-helix domain-containing protein [Clostridia bacterium]|jgi:excisionase family DNA binding protein|nr:helix-turn-helix domain-containing protein [Clostridia bacterium]MCI2014032.1 helix-turn-helix domain-containing protein [Clostridia bacterium]